MNLYDLRRLCYIFAAHYTTIEISLTPLSRSVLAASIVIVSPGIISGIPGGQGAAAVAQILPTDIITGSFTFPEKNAFDGEQAVWVLICIGGDGRFLTNIDFGVFAVRTVFIVSISTSVVALPNSITQRYSSAYSHSMPNSFSISAIAKPVECTAAQSNVTFI